MIVNNFDVISVDNAAEPFTSVSNDYSCFNSIVEKYGVYVYIEKSTGHIQYVGMAAKQDLKTRISQNYKKGDTGGTFRISYCKEGSKSFEEFKFMLSTCSIKIISIRTEQKSLIEAIEAILIAALTPKYNKQ